MSSADETELNDAMRDLYRRWKDECEYNASRFIQLLDREGPIDTATKLVSGKDPSKGFLTLHAYKRLSLTVEALIISDPFRHLFSERVVEAARARLRGHGFHERA